MTLALLLAWEVTEAGAEGDGSDKACRLYSALAGDVTIGYGLKNSGLCRFLFLPFVSKMVAQRNLILKAVLSELPFLLTRLSTESLVGTLLLAPIISGLF